MSEATRKALEKISEGGCQTPPRIYPCGVCDKCVARHALSLLDAEAAPAPGGETPETVKRYEYEWDNQTGSGFLHEAGRHDEGAAPGTFVQYEDYAALFSGLHALEEVPVVGEILVELSRATTKFPTWPTDPLHALAVLGEEFGELTKAILQHTYEPKKGVTKDDIREEAIQTAAMAVRFAISLDCYEYAPRDQHSQGALVRSPKAGDAA